MKILLMNYARPEKLEEALNLLSEGEWQILAGGTDFYPALNDRPPPENILDVTAIDDVSGIHQAEGYWVFGARTTWSDIISADLPSAFDGLKQAAREVGSVQIQNRATLAGNLCNASPAADGVPPLMSLDAEVELASAEQTRRLPIGVFILGNRRTALNPNEIVTRVLVPEKSAAGHSAFLKLGARKYLVISISMVAARLVISPAGVIEEAAISVGACSEVAKRLPELEEMLQGAQVSRDVTRKVSRAHLNMLSPIDDVRAPAPYRMDASLELVRRTLGRVVSEAGF